MIPVTRSLSSVNYKIDYPWSFSLSLTDTRQVTVTDNVTCYIVVVVVLNVCTFTVEKAPSIIIVDYKITYLPYVVQDK